MVSAPEKIKVLENIPEKLRAFSLPVLPFKASTDKQYIIILCRLLSVFIAALCGFCGRSAGVLRGVFVLPEISYIYLFCGRCISFQERKHKEVLIYIQERYTIAIKQGITHNR